MKFSIRDAKNKETSTVQAPPQFSEEYRPDLIARAVLSLQSRARQPYGSDPMAGKKSSAKISRRRRDYRGSYGYGISRVPRKILSRRGTRMNWVGAFVPGTVGGRRAHPPKVEKDWEQKINKKENRKAIRSALAATADKALVQARGHKVPKEYPFLIADDFERMDKTRDVVAALVALGLAEELDRAEQKTVRAGIGKLRGRRYKRRKGPLIVVSGAEVPLLKAAKNIAGIDVCVVDKLNAELLAPGTAAGRLTLFTVGAVERLAQERLFMADYAAPKQENAAKAAPVPAEKEVEKKALAKKAAAKSATKTATKTAPKKAVA